MTLLDGERASDRARALGPPQHRWEDLSVGDRIRSTGITVTEAHLVGWAGLTGDIVEFHLNEEAAAATHFGRRVAHGPFTLSVALGLMTQTGWFTGTVAWLGLEAVRATAPVVIGDTISAVATLSAARPTRKPENGLWTLDYDVVNQREELVMTFTSSFLVLRRQH